MGRNREAEGSLREAARVNPRDEVAYNNLGAALIALNRPRDAANAFHQATPFLGRGGDGGRRC